MPPPLTHSISSVKRQFAYRKPICPFVSSTFQDFQVERDFLVKKVFPALDALCHERGTYFAPCDLRWGINDAQVNAGHVVRLCLDYIVKSAPFFICLLGERYGSHRPLEADPLPSRFQDLPPDADWLDKNYLVAASAGYDWLLEEENQFCSVVEIEVILAALLGNNESCRFYFRQQNHVDDLFTDLPPHEREEKLQVYYSESDYAHQKVRDLKTHIAKKGLSIKYFRTPEELGVLVLEDWREIIDSLYPPLDHLISETDGHRFREWTSHEAFAETRRRVFVRSPEWNELLSQISEFAASALDDDPLLGLGTEHIFPVSQKKSVDSSQTSILVLVGERGCGKTAVLANWVREFCDENPEIPVVAHYVGSSAESSDVMTFMRRCIHELRIEFNQLGNDSELNSTCSADKRSEYHHLCEMFVAAASLGPCVLVIDGIDEISGSFGSNQHQVKELPWLPCPLPPQCRIIMSTAKNDRAYKSLSQRKDTEIIAIPTISDPSTKSQIIKESLAMHCKCLNQNQLKRIVSCKLSDRPLFLSVLANELRVFGVYSHLDFHLDSYLDAGSIRDLWSRIIQRWVRDYGWSTDHTWSEITAGTNPPAIEMTGWVADALRLIAVSRHGLTQSEILTVLEQIGYTGDYKVSSFDWALFRSSALDSLFERPGGLLNFFHHHLKEAVEYTLLGCVSGQDKVKSQNTEGQGQTDKCTFHAHLAKYFAKHSIEERKLEELPWQLKMSGDLNGLRSLLAQPGIFLALNCEKPTQQCRLDLMNYWKHLTQAGYDASATYCEMLRNTIGVDVKADDSFYDTSEEEESESKVAIPAITMTFSSQLCLDEGLNNNHEGKSDFSEKVKENYSQLEVAQLCKATGQFLSELGFFDQSEQVLLHAHDHLYKNYPLSDEEQQLMCGIEESIANLYLYQLKQDKAERWYCSALSTISEQLQKCEDAAETMIHEETKGRLLDHLGSLKTHAHRFQEAEELLLDALECMDAVCSLTGKATVQYHIGVLRMKQKNYSKAEEYFRLALSVREQWFGNSHPLVAEILNDLAGLLYAPDNNKSYDKYEAEALYRRALHIRETCFGQSHLLTATTLFHLGRLLKSKGSCTCKQEAVTLLRKSLDIRATKLGYDHKITKAVRRCLTQVESALKLGQYDHGPAKTQDTRNVDRPYSSLSWREPDLKKFDRIRHENVQKHGKSHKNSTSDKRSVVDTITVSTSKSSDVYEDDTRLSPVSMKPRPHTAHSSDRRHWKRNGETNQLEKSDMMTVTTTEDSNLDYSQRSDSIIQDLGESMQSLDAQTMTNIDMKNADSLSVTTSQEQHYIDSFALNITPQFITKTTQPSLMNSGEEGGMRPHSAPVKMLKYYHGLTSPGGSSPRFHKPAYNKKRLHSAPVHRSNGFQNSPGRESIESIDSTIHKSKCYIPGPHTIDVNNAYSMRGPHTTIYSLLGPPHCPRESKKDVHHSSAWYHVPGRYPTIEKPFPAKRSQARLMNKRKLRTLSRESKSTTDSNLLYPPRSKSVVTFNEEVQKHSWDH